MQDIKSCPHCGGKAYLNQNSNRKGTKLYLLVKCCICGSQGKVFTCGDKPADPTEQWEEKEVATEDAISAWNLRHNW